MASTELELGFRYPKADGTTSTGSKTFKGCAATVSTSQATSHAKDYALIVNGNLTSGKHKQVTDLDVA